MKKLIAFVVAFAAATSFCAAFTYDAGETEYSDIPANHVLSEPDMDLEAKTLVFVTEVEAPTSELVEDTILPVNEDILETEPAETAPVNPIPETKPKRSESVSKEDIELLALLTMAEAEGEPEEGKRLVIDTVLNRADFGGEFPNSIRGVIYQRNQFSSMWNGRVDRCYVIDEIVQLVIEELDNRTNYDVIFFNAGHYSQYGVPMFQVGNHYFSSYN